MKIIANKIDKKKTKKRKIWWYGILAVCYLFAIIFVVNDTWLYQMPVVRVKQIVTTEAGAEQGTRGTDVKKYTQKMTGNILNGTHKGETVEVTQYLYRNRNVKPGISQRRLCVSGWNY